MTSGLPNYQYWEQSPKVEQDFRGVAIAVPDSVNLAGDPGLPVYGGFQLADDEAAAVSGGDPFRALVMLLIDTSSYHSRSFKVAGNAILLEPVVGHGLVRGYFNVDVFQMAQIGPHPGRYFVSAYLDRWHSRSFPVDVRG